MHVLVSWDHCHHTVRMLGTSYRVCVLEEWPVIPVLFIEQQQEAPCFHLFVEEEKPGIERSTSSVPCYQWLGAGEHWLRTVLDTTKIKEQKICVKTDASMW